MRLTNFMRGAFVRAVMADVPQKNFDDEIVKTAKDAVHSIMPKEILVFAAQEETANWIHTGWLSLPDGCSSFSYYRPEGGLRLSEKAPKHWKKLEELGKAKEAQKKERRELQTKLETCAAACTTRKQLAEMLPEFEKYLPADETKAVRQFPVVTNVVADFVKAGWPKDKNKGARA